MLSGELCLNTTRPNTMCQKHWWTEESLAVNIRPAAPGLNQQDHTELEQKMGWTFGTSLR